MIYRKIPNSALRYLHFAIHEHREGLEESFHRYKDTFEEAKILLRPVLAIEWKDLMEAYTYFAQENPISSTTLWLDIRQTTELLKSDDELRVLIEEIEQEREQLKERLSAN